MNRMNIQERLTPEEVAFCELYVNGCSPYAGNAAKCHTDVFGSNPKTAKSLANKLLAKKDIQDFIAELEEQNVGDEAKNMKKFISETLVKIIEETSTAQYTDRRGNKLSPAPLRSVAVSAAKALMDIHPIKEAQKVSLEGAGEGGITFNVIVPDQEKVNTQNNN